MRHNYLRKFVFSFLVFLTGLLVLFFMVWGLKITEPQPVGVYITSCDRPSPVMSCLCAPSSRGRQSYLHGYVNP